MYIKTCRRVAKIARRADGKSLAELATIKETEAAVYLSVRHEKTPAVARRGS
jgi:hypothetical protein